MFFCPLEWPQAGSAVATLGAGSLARGGSLRVRRMSGDPVRGKERVMLRRFKVENIPLSNAAADLQALRALHFLFETVVDQSVTQKK